MEGMAPVVFGSGLTQTRGSNHFAQGHTANNEAMGGQQGIGETCRNGEKDIWGTMKHVCEDPETRTLGGLFRLLVDKNEEKKRGWGQTVGGLGIQARQTGLAPVGGRKL